ncbi:reverse transcriptase domain-containing protein [Tanacetum coccineum]
MLGGNASMAIAPSMLERVKSVNLSSFYSTALSEQVNSASELTGSDQVNITKELTRAPSFLDCVKSFKLTSPFKSDSPSDDTFTSQDEQFDVPSDHDVVEDHNDASDDSRYNNLYNVSGKSSLNLAKRSTSHLTKSSSEKRVVESVDNGDEDVDRRRPATMRESAVAKDECVNAKADDFIQRFKQQLKLQRLDSLQRFRDMLNRGT